MKTVTITELKQMKPDEIKDGSCLEVTFNCEHLGFFVVGAVEEMRTQIVARMSQIDAMRGK